MNADNLLSEIKILFEIYKVFNPILGGSAALYLQKDNVRYPKDIDIFIPLDRSEFLEKVYLSGIKMPKLSHKVDWIIGKDLDLSDIIELQGIRMYNKDLIWYYKGIYEGSKDKSDKHKSDLEFQKILFDLGSLINSDKIKFHYNNILNYIRSK